MLFFWSNDNKSTVNKQQKTYNKTIYANNTNKSNFNYKVILCSNKVSVLLKQNNKNIHFKA